MQWILQDFEDTWNMADALGRLQIPYSWHKVIPFVGDLAPPPMINDPNAVVMVGSYALWRYAQAHHLKPGVFKIRPFVHERPWHPFLLNGADALFLTLRDVAAELPDDGRSWFLRPVDDSKEAPGKVMTAREIRDLANKVLALQEHEIPKGSLRHDTRLMLTKPVRILQEWRLWVVREDIVTYSLYKDGSRIVYRHEIDEDALAFAKRLVMANPDYSAAYVMDGCRTEDGLRMLSRHSRVAPQMLADSSFVLQDFFPKIGIHFWEILLRNELHQRSGVLWGRPFVIGVVHRCSIRYPVGMLTFAQVKRSRSLLRRLTIGPRAISPS